MTGLNGSNGRRRPVLTPAQVLGVGFLLIIAVGTALLSLPAATATGEQASFSTALFTATSATCVTGLIVVPTSTYWSPLGHWIILALIQIGGLGFMTMSTLVFLLLGKRISLRERLIIQEAMGQFSLSGLVRLTRTVLLFTAIMEGIGAIIFTLRFLPLMPAGQAVKFGIFHAVSAFCNAGFDLFGDSFTRFVGDAVVNLNALALIIIGGLGFFVMTDLWSHRRWAKLSLHSRVVIKVTGILIAVGFIAILALEWGNPATMGTLSPGARLWSALFHSVTPRTAGFNTLDTAALTQPALLLTMVLMFIGASPGSTGGGVKTTTFATLIIWVWSVVTGKGEVELARRRLPRDVLEKALAVVFTGLTLILVALMALLVTEGASFLDTAFETLSAFGTVGLSTGLTGRLSVPGRFIVTILMYAGRLGPLTLVAALAQRRAGTSSIRLPEDRVIVG